MDFLCTLAAIIESLIGDGLVIIQRWPGHMVGKLALAVVLFTRLFECPHSMVASFPRKSDLREQGKSRNNFYDLSSEFAHRCVHSPALIQCERRLHRV